MGRPIKKSFFANLNAPYQDQATGGPTGFGGEGVASYGSIVAGSGWTTAPTVTVSAPDKAFAGAATATVAAHYKALSFSTTANGTGYAVGDVLEARTGTASVKARAPVAAIVLAGTPTITNGGGNYDVGPNGDQVTFSHANLSTPITVQVTSVSGGGVATGITVVTPGIWVGAGTPPTDTSGFTAAIVPGSGPVDNNGAGLVLSGLTWGVYSFGTVSVPGDYTAFPSTGASGTLNSVSPATGSGAKATITMGLLSVEVLTAGRGYTSASDAAITFSGSTGAAATAVLTSSYGNGLKIAAFVPGGSSGVDGDIMKQEASRRYLVDTAQGTGQCKLVAKATGDLLAGEMNLIATDSLGKQYYVLKLTARRALLKRLDSSGGYEFADESAAGWTIAAASTGFVSIASV